MVEISVDWVALAAFLAAVPLAVLLHELGHAIPALVAGGRAELVIGGTDGQSIRLGPLTLTLGYPYVSAFGLCRWEGIDSQNVQRLIHLGGPAMTVLVVVGLLTALESIESGVVGTVLRWLLVFEVVTLVVTIIPIEYPSWFGPYAGRTSDGYKFLQTLTGGSG